MKNKIFRKISLAILFISVLFQSKVLGQPAQQTLPQIIRQHDSLFWKAYNSCNVEGMEKYFTDDLEFYHDKGGFSKGKEQTLDNTRKNLCSNNNFRLRRDEVPGSTQVFPLTKNDTIYGAVFSGDHLFYISENNNPFRLTGKARFTHVWLYQNNTWKMSRIISYDHQPVAAPKAVIQVTAATLDLYVGNYQSANFGKITVEKQANHLVLSVGEKKMDIYPESETKFFFKDRDLVFEFQKGSDGRIAKMIVWENDKLAEEALRIK